MPRGDIRFFMEGLNVETLRGLIGLKTESSSSFFKSPNEPEDS
jgi:hypothetical protein